MALETNTKLLVDDLDNKLSTDLQELESSVTSQLADIETNKADKTEVNDLASEKADLSYVNSSLEFKAEKTELQQVSLAYKESYATLTALQTAYPTGNAYNHSVLSDGMIYTWNGSAWVSTQIQANGTGIADKSLTPKKLDRFYLPSVIGKNLFDKSVALKDKGIQVANGTVVDIEGYYVSDFVAVAPGTNYFLKYSGWSAFYDVNKVYISGGAYNGFTPPANASFFRFTTTTANLDTQQLEVGTSATAYEPYRMQLAPGEIDKSEFIKDGIILETKLAPALQGKINASSNNLIRDYNAEVSLPKYRAALAKLDSGQTTKFNVCFVGDSITEGIGSDATYANYLQYSYLAKLRARFTEKYGDVGKGFIPSYYANQITYNGTWNDFTLIGIAGYSKYTSAADASITVSFNGTGLDILTYTGTSSFRGNIGVTIDGGAEQLISLVEASAAIKLKNVADGLVDGAHTAVIRNAEASKEFHVIGIREKKGTKGIILNMCAKSGQTATTLTKNSNVMTSEIDVWQPTLTVIATITNDIGNSIDVNTYKTNVQTLITRAKQYGDVLLVANNVREDKTKEVQQPYVDALRDLAITNKCAFLDFFTRWDFKGQSHGLMDDILHPNKAGHQEIANALTRVLLGEKI